MSLPSVHLLFRGTQLLFYLILVEFCCYEALYVWEDSYEYWWIDSIRNTNPDADAFLNIWENRFHHIFQTIMRDDLFSRILQRMMHSLFPRGIHLFAMYVAIVHFRLHSMASIMLEEMGLGVVNDVAERVLVFFGWSDNNSGSLDDVPDLIDEEEEEQEQEQERGEGTAKNGQDEQNGKNRSIKAKKRRKKLQVPKKREKPDSWLTYDKNLGVIPLGVARQWKNSEQRRAAAQAISAATKRIPAVRNMNDIVNDMESVD